jgi:peptide chain release factor 3
MEEFRQRRRRDLATDIDGNLVFLAESQWSLKVAQENHPEVQFHFTSEVVN